MNALMKGFAGITSALLLAVPTLALESDAEVEARRNGLELAGAFTNDGFKIRDGYWTGIVKPNEPQLIAVSLYAGNQYWFAVGDTDSARKLSVTLYDETGQQVPTESYDAPAKAAAGFSPNNSGQYYVSITVTDGEPSTCCLVYCYK